MSTEDQHVTAVLAALTALDAVPFTIQGLKRIQTKPLEYSEVHVDPRAGGVNRSTATTTRTGYYLTVKCFGRTDDGARRMRTAAHGLRGASLVIDGERTTPLQLETTDPITDDDEPGWYSGALQFTYVI